MDLRAPLLFGYDPIGLFGAVSAVVLGALLIFRIYHPKSRKHSMKLRVPVRPYNGLANFSFAGNPMLGWIRDLRGNRVYIGVVYDSGTLGTICRKRHEVEFLRDENP